MGGRRCRRPGSDGVGDSAMSNRSILSGVTLVTMLGALAGTAAADDWGVSLRFGSGGSSYVVIGDSYCAPRSYVVRTDGCRTYSYAPRVQYVESCAPRSTRYRSCYPAPYATTYTRSSCFSEPVRHRRTVSHRSIRHRTVRTPTYVAPRRSDCSSRRTIRSHRSSWSPSRYFHRNDDCSYRHGRSHRQPRIRVHRR